MASTRTPTGATQRALALLALLGTVNLGGCGVETSHGHATPIGQGGAGEGGSPAGEVVGCQEGSTRDCHVPLGQHGNILSCFDGVQTCTEGAWSACGDGEVSNHTMPGGDENAAAPSDDPSAMPGADHGLDPAGNLAPNDAPGSTPMALSDAGPCKNNPCDPTCKNFDEKPPGGGIVTATGWVAGGWIGVKNRMPPGLVNKGMKQPCDSALDCQFGFYCDNPVSGTCSHHKCAPGAALDDGCDPCVAQICDKYPSCCAPASNVGTCAHNPCTAGAKLTAGCDAPSGCVSKICAKDPSCCNGSWSQKCADMVPNVCGQTCPGWTDACVDAVHDVCGAFCEAPPAPTCAHSICYSGEALDGASCGKCATDVCKVRPSCCTGAWDDACVALVPGVCGEACPAQGACKQWVAGQKDKMCDGPDLVQGIPCQNGAGQNVAVVCNVGTKPAPKGLEVVAYPGNSGKMPSPEPKGGNPKSCGTTNQPIPPGSCINVDCTAALPNGSEEIFVNPPGPNHVDECLNNNNWSLFPKPGTPLKCEAPLCSGAQTSVVVRKPNLYFAVDRSAALPNADFKRARDGIKAFLQDQTNFLDPVPKYPGYAVPPGVGVELAFFPDTTGKGTCTANTCDQGQCSPRVARADVFATIAPVDVNEQALLNTLNSIGQDSGSAPTSAALAATLLRASSYFVDVNEIGNINVAPPLPGEDTSVVLMLASEPPSCNTATAGLAGLAATAYATYGIKTFVIGLGISQTTVDAIAQAGGGMGFALPLGPGLDGAIASALKKIRHRVFPCSFEVPPPELFDATSPQVTYGPGGYSAQAIQWHADASQCNPAPGNTPGLMGFYLRKDDQGNPVAIELCEATCTNVNRDSGGGVRTRLQCAPSNTSELYQATCPAGTHAQWGFLAYDTTTPFATKVEFKARIAQSKEGLEGKPFTSLATAQSAVWPSTSTCKMSGPSPCPVDLVNKFGGINAAQAEWLELQLVLTPDSAKTATPTVNNWQITYSCPPTD